MRRRYRIDLNADVGEGYDDEPLFPFVTSVNVACGAHAGDPETMRRTAERAAALGCAVGAHPSFPDRAGFGRAITTSDPREIGALVFEQTTRLRALAKEVGVALTHVKPHGALYNLAAIDEPIAVAIAESVRRIDPSLRLFGLAHSYSISAASRVGLHAVEEAFVDRAYRRDGTLVPRTDPGAVLHDPVAARERALALARGTPVSAEGGGVVRVLARTLCLHGDTENAVDMAREVHSGLCDAGIDLARP